MHNATHPWANTLTRLGLTRRKRTGDKKPPKTRSLQLEPLEQRQLLAIDLGIADFSASEHDLLVEYDVAGDDVPSFDVGIYSSTDGTTPETLLMTHAIDDPLDLAAGTHGVSIDADFTDVPEDYYLVAQLDAGSSVDETDESNNT